MKKFFLFSGTETLTAVCISIFFTGCAVMNTSVLETGETIEPGNVKGGAEIGLGPDLAAIVILDHGIEPSDAVVDVESAISPIVGFRGGFGIRENQEMNGKIWISPASVGISLYLKNQIRSDTSKSAIAIMPGLNFILSEWQDDEKRSDMSSDDRNVRSAGAQIPVVFSDRINPNAVIYGAARYSMDIIAIDYPDIDFKGTYFLHRIGFIAGLSLERTPFFLRAEYVYENYMGYRGGNRFVSYVNFGFGFEF